MRPGKYTITGIFPGTYPKVFARGGPVTTSRSRRCRIASRAQHVNWALRRDWAASAGGATIADFTPPDYTPFGCGPAALIDQSQGVRLGQRRADQPRPAVETRSRSRS